MTAPRVGADRYPVERELGRGGMSTVYLARDEELGRPVALKVLAGHLAGEEGFRERFLREARLAARLSHPNVVAVYDAGEDDDGRPCIVMEYVPGTTLAHRLAAGRTEPAEAVELGLQACAGLAHAHEAGLVHRDVKPGNLLLREDGALKVADFGIARAVEGTQLTQVGSVLGTAAYLSPEQAAGEPVTPAADVYGLGVVLYELLTGRTPYVFESLPELLVKHREETIVPVRELAPETPAEIEALVMRCLARSPEYRPASAGELARELRAAGPEAETVRLAATEGRPADEEGTARLPAGRPPGGSGRRRAGIAAGVAVLALGAVAAGYAVAELAGGADGAPPAETEARGGRAPAVPLSEDPAEQARNLAGWLRERAG